MDIEARRGAVGDGHGGGDRLALPPSRAEGYSVQAHTKTQEGSQHPAATLSRALVVELDAQTTQYGPARHHAPGGDRPQAPACPIGRN